MRPDGNNIMHPLVIQLDRSLALMEQELARHSLRQEWLPIKNSFFVALAKQLIRLNLLPDSIDVKVFAETAHKESERFINEHRLNLKNEGIVPKTKLEGFMLAAACLHRVNIIHWIAASEGLIETTYSPPHSVECRGKIFVCSVGPVLWSTIGLGSGESTIECSDKRGIVSEARISEEISQRLLRAQALSTAVRWVNIHRAQHAPQLEYYTANTPSRTWLISNEIPRTELLSEFHAQHSMLTKSGIIESRNGNIDDGKNINLPVAGDSLETPKNVPVQRRARSTSKDTQHGSPPTEHVSRDATNNEEISEQKNMFLIDVSGLIFRAYHAIPAQMTGASGVANNAVFGFCRMVLKLLQSVPAGSCVVPVFDHGSHTFRKDLYPDYKANRPPLPEDLIPQFALVREATRAMGLRVVDAEGFEADDVIATYARIASESGAAVTIVSSDKDLCQLVSARVRIWDPMKSVVIGPSEVVQKFGVAPERVADVQALSGDAADNIPGIKGIGPKTAAALINQFGDLDALLQRHAEVKPPRFRDMIKQAGDALRLFRQLVQLRSDVSVPPLSDFVYKPPPRETLRSFFAAQRFNSLIADLDRPARAAGAPVPASSSTAQDVDPPVTRKRARAAKGAAVPEGEDAGAGPVASEADAGTGDGVAEAALVDGQYEVAASMEQVRAWVKLAADRGRLGLVVHGSSPDPQVGASGWCRAW